MLPVTRHSHADDRAGVILDWFVENARDFPWRHTHDAWSILVSEVMLTQTRAERVRNLYRPFLDRFPTTAACAQAPVDDVVDAWGRLGYIQRAVNLHRSATIIENELGGRFPDTVEGLRALPGVGPYIAHAVTVFAFGGRTCGVDTNVARIISRWAGRPMSQRELQQAADTLVPPGSAWAWNQALFEFGAQVCTATDPSCDACPVRDWCAWAGHDADPATT